LCSFDAGENNKKISHKDARVCVPGASKGWRGKRSERKIRVGLKTEREGGKKKVSTGNKLN